jgi:hypothetical protein
MNLTLQLSTRTLGTFPLAFVPFWVWRALAETCSVMHPLGQGEEDCREGFLGSVPGAQVPRVCKFCSYHPHQREHGGWRLSCGHLLSKWNFPATCRFISRPKITSYLHNRLSVVSCLHQTVFAKVYLFYLMKIGKGILNILNNIPEYSGG